MNDSLVPTLIQIAGTLLLAIFFVLSLSTVIFYLFSIAAAIQFFSAKPEQNFDFQPPLTVLKPVCGLDENTYENLASFCTQDYPNYQLIFGTQDPNDPCIAIVQQLIQDFPDQDIQFVIDPTAIGINPKVNNLHNIALKAKHDLLVLADSDIWVDPNYLKQVIQPLSDPTVGVVTCMYRSRSQNLISAFEALSISTEFFPGVLVARKLEGMAFAFGATIALRQSVLAEIGGFEAIVNYIGDDFQLGYLPAKAGYKVVLSEYVVDHVLSTATISELLKHQTRWFRNTRFARSSSYFGLIFTYGTISSLLFFTMTQASALGWIVLITTWTVRYCAAWLIGVHCLQDAIAKQLLLLVPLRDGLSFCLWCYSFFGNTVEWRGRRLELTAGGAIVNDVPPAMS
ncbi:bacteriohopanetetrol glucosamine biosynthesis glycosyltransferase HpnI [Cyanobacteria bacterium FACHB-DQ100]|nr:bacteriohopanetetrol glucosamine biosynthesis glycosyltransferase HpnI [Cyanobacteria bacterium FACHB-DQ100]